MEAIKICTNRIQGSFAISSGDAKVPLLDAIETLGDIAVDATASEQSLLSKAYDSLLSIPPSSDDSKATSAALSALVKLWFALFSISDLFVEGHLMLILHFILFQSIAQFSTNTQHWQNHRHVR
jgi:hypothetical protein